MIARLVRPPTGDKEKKMTPDDVHAVTGLALGGTDASWFPRYYQERDG